MTHAIVYDRDSLLKHIDKGKKRKKTKKQIGVEKCQRKAKRLKREARARKHKETKAFPLVEHTVSVSFEEIEAAPGDVFASK